jgi:hypothetical protein
VWSRLTVVHEQSSKENVNLLQGKFLGYKMWKGHIKVWKYGLKIKQSWWAHSEFYVDHQDFV